MLHCSAAMLQNRLIASQSEKENREENPILQNAEKGFSFR